MNFWCFSFHLDIKFIKLRLSSESCFANVNHEIKLGATVCTNCNNQTSTLNCVIYLYFSVFWIWLASVTNHYAIGKFVSPKNWPINDVDDRFFCDKEQRSYDVIVHKYRLIWWITQILKHFFLLYCQSLLPSCVLLFGREYKGFLKAQQTVTELFEMYINSMIMKSSTFTVHYVVVVVSIFIIIGRRTFHFNFSTPNGWHFNFSIWFIFNVYTEQISISVCCLTHINSKQTAKKSKKATSNKQKNFWFLTVTTDWIAFNTMVNWTAFYCTYTTSEIKCGL